MKPQAPPPLIRSAVAQQADINPEAFRYYEREDLLDSPRRTVHGHRLYTDTDLKRLAVIREKIRSFQTMEQALASLVTDRDGQGDMVGCPIADFIHKGSPSHISNPSNS